MKNKKLRELTLVFALRGFIFGLVVALIAFLLAADSDAYHDSERTFADFVHYFPSFWIIVLLPFLTAAGSYLLAFILGKEIKKKNAAMENEERRSKRILNFVEKLSAGDTSAALVVEEDDTSSDNKSSKKKKDDKGNELVNSLLKLQKNLKSNETADFNRRKEESERTWVTQGIAQFGEILRRNNDDMQQLSYEILRFLVKYCNLLQGGIFLINKEEIREKDASGNSVKKEIQYFELTAFIAYDRRKYAEKRIEWGEGLVGRCALEKETINMTQVPSGYVTVTSGLGDSEPHNIILLPLKSNDIVYGVMELASFVQLQKHEIEYLERTAESIAMTISTVQTNMQTAKLLKETQEQTKKMRKQEEEMHQNMEEMKATQEANEKNEAEMKGFISAIDHASISIEFSTDGTISKVNDNFLRTFGYKREEVLHQNMRIFFFKDELKELDELLDTVNKGETFNGRAHRRSKIGEDVWLLSTYTPVYDKDNKILKVLSLENDIRDQVKLEREMQDSQKTLEVSVAQARKDAEDQLKKVEAVKVRNETMLDGMLDAIITTDNNGTVEFFNKAAEALWCYGKEEVLGQNVAMLFSQDGIGSNDFIKAFVTPDMPKEIGVRKEVPIRNKYGEDVSVLVLLCEANVDGDKSYTAFIQNVEVELF